MAKTYITTAIPYVNGTPHIGHAMDYCLADTFARYARMRGDDVRFQAGVDEHGNKIFQKANSLNLPVQEYVDKNAESFKTFISDLNVSNTDFIRTTDVGHVRRCQEIWTRLRNHIYKARYEGWYCSGCERFVTQKEHDENHGICADHAKAYEKLSEENYYLRISDFKERIKSAIESNEMRILPEFRKNELLALLDESPDVSISRSTSQLTWGVPVPDDDTQVMYVWIDALSNYITVLGYPDQDILAWWPAAAQFVGKDILRFHAIIWPAMLLGLGLPLPKVILSHGFVLANGQKMSKTIGNVVDPMDVLQRHGIDAFRYYFLRHVDTFLDSDFTWDKFEESYNNELANDLGNLVQRLAAMMAKNNLEYSAEQEYCFSGDYIKLMDDFEFARAFDLVWEKVRAINRQIDEKKPWELAKVGKNSELAECLHDLVSSLLVVNYELSPFLPNVTSKISEIFTGNVRPPETPLFPKEQKK